MCPVSDRHWELFAESGNGCTICRQLDMAHRAGMARVLDALRPDLKGGLKLRREPKIPDT